MHEKFRIIVKPILITHLNTWISYTELHLVVSNIYEILINKLEHFSCFCINEFWRTRTNEPKTLTVTQLHLVVSNICEIVMTKLELVSCFCFTGIEMTWFIEPKKTNRHLTPLNCFKYLWNCKEETRQLFLFS